MKYYLLDENKNLVEGFDKEGFLALLEQAIENGSLEGIDENSAVASKIKSVLNGTTHHIEFVTQAQYNQLVSSHQLVTNTYYFITDDSSFDDLETLVNDTKERVDEIEYIKDITDASDPNTAIFGSDDKQTLIKNGGSKDLNVVTNDGNKRISLTEELESEVDDLEDGTTKVGMAKEVECQLISNGINLINSKGTDEFEIPVSSNLVDSTGKLCWMKFYYGGDVSGHNTIPFSLDSTGETLVLLTGHKLKVRWDYNNKKLYGQLLSSLGNQRVDIDGVYQIGKKY